MAITGRVRLERRHSPLNDITTRLACLGPGVHIVVIVKNGTGGQGIAGWSVLEGQLEPGGMVLVPVPADQPMPADQKP